jgi:hypothetical protein
MRNYTGYCNPELDKMIDDGRLVNPIERWTKDARVDRRRRQRPSAQAVGSRLHS